MKDPVIVTGLAPTPLAVPSILDAIRRQECGAVVCFEGVPRTPNEGRLVVSLVYEAHTDLAMSILQRLAEDVADRYGLGGVACVHRVGVVALGEAALVVATTAPHRAEALAATTELIERVKAEAPIWKKEITDSGERWAALPDASSWAEGAS